MGKISINLNYDTGGYMKVKVLVGIKLEHEFEVKDLR